MHDDVINWKHFPRYWPFVRRIQRSPVNSPHKGQWRGALTFSLICAWTNGWANNRDAGCLGRRAHCDVTVMKSVKIPWCRLDYRYSCRIQVSFWRTVTDPIAKLLLILLWNKPSCYWFNYGLFTNLEGTWVIVVNFINSVTHDEIMTKDTGGTNYSAWPLWWNRFSHNLHNKQVTLFWERTSNLSSAPVTAALYLISSVAPFTNMV